MLETWDITDPADIDVVLNEDFYDIKTQFINRVNLDHYMSGSADDTGYHRQLTMIENNSYAGADLDLSDTGVLYTKDVGGKTEMFYLCEIDSVKTHIQITDYPDTSDAVNWIGGSPSVYTDWINDIAFGWGGIIIAVGRVSGSPDGNGAIYKSINRGASWTLQEVTTYELSTVTYNDGKFVAGGLYGRIYKSDDKGESWDSDTISSANITGIDYRDGLYVVVTEILTTGIIYTSLNFSVWTIRLPSGSGGKFIRLSYGNGKFVALTGEDTTYKMSFWVSSDGITWARNYPSGADVFAYDMVFDNGKFLVVSYDATNSYMLTSSGGVSWTVTSITPLRSICYGNGLYFGVTPSGATYSSPDGSTWTLKGDVNQTSYRIRHGIARLFVCTYNYIFRNGV